MLKSKQDIESLAEGFVLCRKFSPKEYSQGQIPTRKQLLNECREFTKSLMFTEQEFGLFSRYVETKVTVSMPVGKSVA